MLIGFIQLQQSCDEIWIACVLCLWTTTFVELSKIKGRALTITNTAKIITASPNLVSSNISQIGDLITTCWYYSTSSLIRTIAYLTLSWCKLRICNETCNQSCGLVPNGSSTWRWGNRTWLIGNWVWKWQQQKKRQNEESSNVYRSELVDYKVTEQHHAVIIDKFGIGQTTIADITGVKTIL